ncbi:hypothetical protein CHUAL_005052 [Chamberlinius hualienensis]
MVHASDAICSSLLFLLLTTSVHGVVRRCWTCRSRGEYGDCRDPFVVNLANLEYYPGAEPAPCASGWCGKIVEGNEVEYSLATERMCLPRPPDDNQERCAETHWKYRKVYMCFCMGDLCNSASIPSSNIFLAVVTALIYWIFN